MTLLLLLLSWVSFADVPPPPGWTPPPTPTIPGASADCDRLEPLKSVSLLGRLSDRQSTCLESLVVSADTPASIRIEASELLISNSFGRGDRTTWYVLAQRHVTTLQPVHPMLHYRMAIYLIRLGPQASEMTIQHASTALQQGSDVWTGETRVLRRFVCFKLRAIAAGVAFDGAPADPKMAQRSATYAAEWMRAAEARGVDATQAQRLCVKAGGDAKCALAER